MITVYKKTAQTGSLATLDQFESGTWINVVHPQAEEIDSLAHQLKLDFFTLKTALEVDEKPRVEKDNLGNVFIIIRVPTRSPDGRIQVLSLTIIVTPGSIVTIAPQETNILTDFLTGEGRDFYTTKKTRFVIQILHRTNFHFQKLLNQIERDIDANEKLLLKSFRNQEIVALLAIQKSLVYFNTAVVGNGKVLEKILTGTSLKLYTEDSEFLEDMIIENKESIQMVNIYSDILANTMDAYASIISNNLNIVMKFLTSITIILALPTIVASVYGMNVALPFQAHPLAFWYTLIISLFFVSVATLLFTKKNYF